MDSRRIETPALPILQLIELAENGTASKSFYISPFLTAQYSP